MDFALQGTCFLNSLLFLIGFKFFPITDSRDFAQKSEGIIEEL